MHRVPHFTKVRRISLTGFLGWVDERRRRKGRGGRTRLTFSVSFWVGLLAAHSSYEPRGILNNICGWRGVLEFLLGVSLLDSIFVLSRLARPEGRKERSSREGESQGDVS